MNRNILRSASIPAVVWLIIFLCIPGMTFGADEYTTIGLMADALWQTINDNSEEMPELPRMDYLISTGLYDEKRLESLPPNEAWNEAHSLAAMQSAYLEQLADYTSEFIFVTALQYRTRTQVLEYERISPIDPENSAVPYLMHQISDELVGISYVYGGTVEVFDVSQRTVLADAIIETTVLFIDEFEPVSLQALYYIAGNLPGLESDPQLRQRFEEFAGILYQKLEAG